MPLDDTYFLPYQRRWIEDKSPLKIMEKSRQIGMSFAAAYALVREQAFAQNRFDSWVSSRDELQAELFISDCQRFAQLLSQATATFSRVVLDERGTQARCLTFAKGGRIHGLSSNPNAQAGKRGTRLLDEFALHGDPELLYSIALPGITWGGRLEIISTHRGEGNFFNQLVTEITRKGNPKGFSHHRVTLEDALAEGFLDRLKAKLPSDDPRQKMNEDNYFAHIRSQCADESAFQQEYMCNPCADTDTFLSASLIYGAESTDALPAEPSGSLYIGVDLGRVNDRTVIWVLEKIASTFFTRSVTTLKDMPFSAQEALLARELSHPLCRGCAIDASGLGRQFAERMRERFGPTRVEGLVFTDERKATLAYTLKDFLERGWLKIPSSQALRADLLSLRKSYSPSGNLIFSAPRTTGGHADHFWALALACHAAQGKTPLFSSHAITIPAREKPQGTLL